MEMAAKFQREFGVGVFRQGEMRHQFGNEHQQCKYQYDISVFFAYKQGRKIYVAINKIEQINIYNQCYDKYRLGDKPFVYRNEHDNQWKYDQTKEQVYINGYLGGYGGGMLDRILFPVFLNL